MPEPEMQRDRDLVLPPNTYALVLDSTKGKVSVYVGAMKSSLSNTDRPVIWDQANRRFQVVDDLERAVQTFQMAGEGQYIVLSNPSPEENYPAAGNSTEAVGLDVGRQVNVPGPVAFPLWPGQSAVTIDGHHLRHNQYLIVRVYDPEQAAANWQSAVVAPQGDATPDELAPPETFAMGQLSVVKGTDVSFYIPPTGIEVVPESSATTFVREAVTLEQLEYCILLDENGAKRFVRGPDVVFPSPTETFVQKDGDRKFRAIELNPHSGIFIKVVDEYSEDGVHPVGEELFITGATDPIYFPRAEHSIIKYGDKTVHHAIAIPAGEGRYVLDRDTGEVNLMGGPKMFLPDPRTQVVVLRILDPHVVQLLFPGNTEALSVNNQRAAVSGRLAPDEHLTNEFANAPAAATRSLLASTSVTSDTTYAGETMRRGTSFTPPRSVVLDTKYEGAVTVNVWPGYAVLVSDKSDRRRVEVGPKAVLLEYDESLMPLTLSTGRPKDDKNLLRTAYLRIINNQVSDRIEVETSDLVRVTLDVGYRVNFEGDTQEEQQRWFAVENYVKVLADHCRSRLRNIAKRHNIADFYGQPIDIIRDALLGESTDGSRSGMVFVENGMRLYDVEVLGVSIEDPSVSQLLLAAQQASLRYSLELAGAEAASDRLAVMEQLKRGDIEHLEETRVLQSSKEIAAIERQREQSLAAAAADLELGHARAEAADLRRQQSEADTGQDLAFSTARMNMDIERLREETTEYLRRMDSVDEKLIAAIQNLGDKNFVAQLTEALGPTSMAAGITTVELFGQIFKNTPFAGMFDTLAERPALSHRNGHSEPVDVR